jgi:hypothetical protein
VSHPAGFQQRPSLPQFKNLRILRTLAEKSSIQGGVPQLRRLGIKQSAEKTLAGSERCDSLPEFLDCAPRDELKESISLTKDAGRVTAVGGASAVPAGGT